MPRIGRSAGAVAALAAGLTAFPGLRRRAVALTTMLEAIDTPMPRPLAPVVAPVDTAVAGVEGRRYTPRFGAPPILVLPGAARQGLRDPRVNRVAQALARAGRDVFIPRLDLYEARLTSADLDRIVTATARLADTCGRGVTMVGFSYGGSLALIAAADGRITAQIARVGVMGAYFDLTGVVQAITTGVSLVGGESIPWRGNPVARDFLVAQVADQLPEPARSQLIDALAGRGGPLNEEALSAYDLLSNREPHRTFELAGRAPRPLQAILSGFSPSTVAAGVMAPVLAMHSTDDGLVPYGELRRLDTGMPQARTLTVGLFRHVDIDWSSPRQWREALGDLGRVWTFATWILRE